MRQRLTPAMFARFLILLLLLLPFGAMRQAADPIRAESAQGVNLYLPAVLQGYASPQRSIFGAEINVGRAAQTAQKGRAAHLYWTRYNGLLWSDVESSPGVRNWAALSARETELKTMTLHGLTPIVVVRGTPDWAQLIPGSACGPIRAESLNAFATFMGELVARYSQPPYNIHHWELGNEPDVSYNAVPGNNIFGCWGVDSDPYFGGRYYAEMLKRVYPTIKQADPTAQVLIGGLLLDCDPVNPPVGKDCRSSKFLEGILLEGGGPFFDKVSYHGYTFWGSTNVDWDVNQGAWQARGGTVVGKLRFIRETMAQYGVSKPVILTEAGLLCHESSACPSSSLEEDKANYAVRLYARAWANGLEGAIWFTLDGPGWRDGALLDSNQNPRPIYSTIQFLTSQLTGATYLGPDSAGSREGYIFQRGNQTYRIYWMNDASVSNITLPIGALVYDKFGRQLFPSGTSLPLTFEPIIIKSSN